MLIFILDLSRINRLGKKKVVKLRNFNYSLDLAKCSILILVDIFL